MANHDYKILIVDDESRYQAAPAPEAFKRRLSV